MMRIRVWHVTAVLAAAVVAGFVGQAASQDSRPAIRFGDPNSMTPEMREAIDQFIKQASQRMQKSLEASDEEWAVLQPKIEKVVRLAGQARGGPAMVMMGGWAGGGEKSDVEKTLSALRTIVADKDSKPDDIKAALSAYREARTKARAELEKAQKELKEVLTLRQEAVLVTMSILE